MKTYVPRVCARCDVPRGTTAFRYTDAEGKQVRNYFHPDCFRKELTAIAKKRTDEGS